MIVYVLNADRQPLMPCRPVIARLLLKAGKAKVRHRAPFMIQLLEQLAHPYVQRLKGRIDPGSGIFGMGVCTHESNEVLYIDFPKIISLNNFCRRL